MPLSSRSQPNPIAQPARYAHLARDTEKASSAKVGDRIGHDLLSLELEDDEAETA